ncbi:MAG: S41 family peptidase [Alphaproteobacteria bacterium]|nr:S41 family peptidase [Alphaproteobacteria bacterium]
MNRLFKAFILICYISIGVNVYANSYSESNDKYYEKFKLVFEKLEKDYVTEPNKQQLIDYAIEGMLNSIDPHSGYFADESLEYFVSSTKGEFGGIGVEIMYDNNAIKVISPIDDLPSYKAGIKAGDYIVKVNDEIVSNLGFNKALHEIRGTPGTKVKVTIIREGESAPLDFELKREIVKITSVKSMIDDNIAYIRIASFTEKVTEELKKSLQNLISESNGNIKGIILDLRNNPGGLLDQAISVSDYFLENQGIIVSTKGRLQSSEIIYRAKLGTEKAIKVPIIVMINEGSASASEIVAAALRDNERALLLGTKSYGKGSVQALFPLDARSACKFTTALYYTPKGISIQAEGVHPDILIEPAKVEYSKKNDSKITFSEASLKNHIKNSQASSASSNTSAPSKGELDKRSSNIEQNSDKSDTASSKSDASPKSDASLQNQAIKTKSSKYLEDFQYARAFDLLRGIIISTSKK